MNSSLSKKINYASFILAWLLFIIYFVTTFSKEQNHIFIGDIPVEIKSVIDVMIAVASLNFVYQFLYEEKKRKKLQVASTVINFFCMAGLAYILIKG